MQPGAASARVQGDAARGEADEPVGHSGPFCNQERHRVMFQRGMFEAEPRQERGPREVPRAEEELGVGDASDRSPSPDEFSDDVEPTNPEPERTALLALLEGWEVACPWHLFWVYGVLEDALDPQEDGREGLGELASTEYAVTHYGGISGAVKLKMDNHRIHWSTMASILQMVSVIESTASSPCTREASQKIKSRLDVVASDVESRLRESREALYQHPAVRELRQQRARRFLADACGALVGNRKAEIAGSRIGLGLDRPARAEGAVPEPPAPLPELGALARQGRVSSPRAAAAPFGAAAAQTEEPLQRGRPRWAAGVTRSWVEDAPDARPRSRPRSREPDRISVALRGRWAEFTRPVQSIAPPGSVYCDQCEAWFRTMEVWMEHYFRVHKAEHFDPVLPSPYAHMSVYIPRLGGWLVRQRRAGMCCTCESLTQYACEEESCAHFTCSVHVREYGGRFLCSCCLTQRRNRAWEELRWGLTRCTPAGRQWRQGHDGAAAADSAGGGAGLALLRHNAGRDAARSEVGSEQAGRGLDGAAAAVSARGGAGLAQPAPTGRTWHGGTVLFPTAEDGLTEFQFDVAMDLATVEAVELLFRYESPPAHQQEAKRVARRLRLSVEAYCKQGAGAPGAPTPLELHRRCKMAVSVLSLIHI